MTNPLKNISPLDGRYAKSVNKLSQYFSEMALMQYRLKVEIEYLIALGEEKFIIELPPFSNDEQIQLRDIYKHFNAETAKEVKQFEQVTNHDVKAIEYYIREKTNVDIHPWIHFALTSEDVNNLAYSIMWQDGVQNEYVPLLLSFHEELKNLAQKYKSTPMLALTHGQPATPTTFGKEIAVFTSRLKRQIDQMKNHSLLGKFGGATGTWSAQVIAYPHVNWLKFSERFIEKLGLHPNLITTQIEPHDSLVENYHQIVRINNILIDLCRDVWSYISRNILTQMKVDDEVGSSTMPHKINPIQFENAEGNMGVSNALLNHLAMKLPISRMQRDLTDSTTIRNQGVALGHSYLAVQNILKGLGRISMNENQTSKELNNHWEVVTEALQTVLRKSGKQDAYEELKSISRGETLDESSIKEFIQSLSISTTDKEKLLSISPSNYIGLAEKLVEIL